MKLSISFNKEKALWYLSRNTYSEPITAFRELVQNACDAQLGHENQKVEIVSTVSQLTVEDWGTGVKDLGDLTTIFTDSKNRSGQSLAMGQFGLGRLAALALGDKVEYRTNNGEVGWIVPMSIKGEDIEVIPMKAESALGHIGTKVTIPNPFMTFTSKEIAKNLSWIFAYRIAYSGLAVFVNGEKVKPTRRMDPPNFQIPFNDSTIQGCLQNYSMGSALSVLIRGQRIGYCPIATNRSYQGWVNCDLLEPTISRDKIVRNKVYEEFENVMTAYISKRFPLRESILEKRLSESLRLMMKHMSSVMRELNLTTEGPIPTADKRHGGIPETGAEEVRLGPDSESSARTQGVEETDKVMPPQTKNHSALREKGGYLRQIRTDTGQRVEFQNLGEETPVVTTDMRNTVYLNVDHPIMGLIDSAKDSLWPYLLPFVSRGFAELTGSPNRTYEQLLKDADSIYQRLLARYENIHAKAEAELEEPITS